MQPVLSGDEMRRADRRAIEELGHPGVTLMERAGAAVAEQLAQRFPDARRPVVLCGRGNNGGDGFVVARLLRAREPQVLLLARRDDVQGDAAAQLQAWLGSGGRIEECLDAARVREALSDTPLIVDALLGTGLSRAPEGVLAEAIAAIGEARARGARVVAVDMPSGLSSDSGTPPGAVAGADLTVTFAAPKRGHVLPPGCDLVGELVVADIGIPVDAAEASVFVMQASDVAAAIGRRAPGAHKGDFGHVLIVAGSLGKTGAGILAGTGALRAGAGLVTVATATGLLPLVATGRAELMTEGLAEAHGGIAESALERALQLARARDAVVLGPGLGQVQSTQRFVRAFAAACPVPLLVDADGLNALAGDRGALARRTAPTVLTPHPGEMARLLGSTAAAVQAQRLESASRLAAETGAVVVLKGQRTLTASPDARVVVNPTGNPGLATAGTGDVLSGILGAFLARGLAAPLAAATAVWLHGSAGDLAAERVGEEALVAGDLLDHLGGAFLKARGHA